MAGKKKEPKKFDRAKAEKAIRNNVPKLPKIPEDAALYVKEAIDVLVKDLVEERAKVYFYENKISALKSLSEDLVELSANVEEHVDVEFDPFA